MEYNTSETTVTSLMHQETTSQTTSNPKLQDFIFYTEAYIQTGILILGFIFNVINYVVFKRTKMTQTFRICLLALTLSDACACLFGSVQLIIESSQFRGLIPFGYWHNAALASHLIYYTFLMFLSTSSLYVILVASVRAYMISQPYKSMVELEPSRLKSMCIVILISIVVLFLPSPFLALWQVCYAKDNTKPVCLNYLKTLPKIKYIKYYFYILSVIFGPLVIIGNIVCLLVIHFTLKKAQQRSDKLTKHEEKHHNYYTRITKMLLIILILDIVWLLPTCIQFIGLVVSRDIIASKITETGIKVYDVIAEILLLCRPTYNIFVYLTANKEYLHTFKQIFWHCKHKSNDCDFLSSHIEYNQFSNNHGKHRSLSNTSSDLSGRSEIWTAKC